MRTTLAVAAIGVLGALAATAPASAEEGGLSMTGTSTVDGPVTLLVENVGSHAATLTGVAAPAGFRCADEPRRLEPGAHATLTCESDRDLTGPSEFRLGTVVDGTARTLRAVVDPPAASHSDEAASSPLLYIDVSADKTQVAPGELVTYTINVEYRGKDFTIRNVVVRSPDVRQCDKDLGDMPPGDKRTFTCSATAPSATFTVRVRVRGYDSGGGVIAAHDNDIVIHVVQHGPGHTPTPTPSKSTGSESSPTPGGTTSTPAGRGPGLAVTGGTAVILASIGGLLLAGGAGLWLLARRRRATG
ncbi:LPXTG cell wall anchor domain-containing protein [Actinorhabdospora filicis]|uniref:LPXTG cell wall anchor domain-containing protein n=1 Tax=Actinorhabdospora filicis TaxID=1785913 RepID=UPI0025534CBB|nr:LPXTG cell wall anchor domain-containing protein [Actinorhabdospora filicis]